MTLNFDGGADDIPTFSLCRSAGLRRQERQGLFPALVRRQRSSFSAPCSISRIASRRPSVLRPASRARARPRCAADASAPAAAGFERSTIAGVYIHATAVNNLIARNAVVETRPAGALPDRRRCSRRWPRSRGVAFSAAHRASAWAAMIARWGGRRHRLPSPMRWRCRWSSRSLASLAALAAMIGLPLRRRRQGPPPAAEELCALPRPARHQPDAVVEEVAGARRRDPQGHGVLLRPRGIFAIAENMSPDGLMSLMNEYLSAMTDVIESHGGYVDKYIGDSIVAVFGAPADDPDHAANAARAALRLLHATRRTQRLARRSSEHQLAQRIGINSGEALVGNFGSRRRFNYSVMSDAVNLRLAARRRQQVLRHHHHRLGDDGCASPASGFAVARTRRRSGSRDATRR